jgi:DNA modification methylase
MERVRGGHYGGRNKHAGYGTRQASGRADTGFYIEAGANLRDVWTIATASSKEAHYAVMPEKLAELCIKAGCPAGGTVLDPFCGSGTTGLVADRLGRNAILIDLNPTNVAMAERRIARDAPLLASVGG